MQHKRNRQTAFGNDIADRHKKFARLPTKEPAVASNSIDKRSAVDINQKVIAIANACVKDITDQSIGIVFEQEVNRFKKQLTESQRHPNSAVQSTEAIVRAMKTLTDAAKMQTNNRQHSKVNENNAIWQKLNDYFLQIQQAVSPFSVLPSCQPAYANVMAYLNNADVESMRIVNKNWQHGIEPALQSLAEDNPSLSTKLCTTLRDYYHKPQPSIIARYKTSINCIASLANGNIITEGNNHTLQIINVDNNQSGQTFNGHSSYIADIAILPNGNIVSARLDGTIKVWDSNSSQCRLNLEAHEGRALCLTILPSGNIVSGGQDCLIKIWDGENGQCLLTLDAHEGDVERLSILPNGNILSESHDETAKVWDSNNFECLQTIEIPSSTQFIAFVDGNTRACTRPDAFLDINVGKQIRIFPILDFDECNCCAVLTNNSYIKGNWNGTLDLWDSSNGKLFTIADPSIWAKGDYETALLKNGNIVSVNTKLMIWDSSTVQCLQESYAFRENISRWRSRDITALLNHPNGHIITGYDDGTIMIWYNNACWQLEEEKKHKGRINYMATLPDDNIVSVSEDGTIKFWDIFSHQCLQTWKVDKDIRCIATLANGNIVTGGDKITVWDRNTGHRVRIMEGHTDKVECIAVLANDKIVSGGDYTLKLWNIELGQCLHTYEGHQDWVTCITILPNGNIISGSHDRTLKLWDGNSGHCLRTLNTYHGRISWITLLANGNFVSGCKEDIFMVWDSETGEHLQNLQGPPPGHRCTVTSIATLANGDIVSGDGDGFVYRWRFPAIRHRQELSDNDSSSTATTQRHLHARDYGQKAQMTPCSQPSYCSTALAENKFNITSSGSNFAVRNSNNNECLHILEGHTDIIYCFAELADGNIVSGSADNTLKVWNGNTGQCVRTLKGHTDLVYCIAILANGNIVSGSWDRTIKIWDSDTGACLQTLSGHKNWVFNIALDDDGNIISSDVNGETLHWRFPALSNTLKQSIETPIMASNASQLFSPASKATSDNTASTTNLDNTSQSTTTMTTINHRH